MEWQLRVRTCLWSVFALAALATQLASPARAGGFTPCESPFIFTGAAANIVPVEYVATSSETETADPERMARLQETAQKLAWLMKLDAWHQPTFGSLGVVSHMFLGQVCDPDEVLRTLLDGGGNPPLQPGQIILMVQGKIFIENEAIFLQTRLRGFRRNEAFYADALPAYVASDHLTAGLRDGKTLNVTLPAIDVTFAPRLLTFGELEAIERAFAEASILRPSPSMTSAGVPLTFGSHEPRAFQVIVEDSDWIHVEDFFSGQRGYIRIDPQVSRLLHRTLPELDFLNGALGYLRFQQTNEGSDFAPAPPLSQRDATRSFDRFLGSEATADETEPRAMAQALAGALAAVGESDWIDARRRFAAAKGVAPSTSVYWNLLGLADATLCCAGEPRATSADPAWSFVNSLSVDPSNVEALRNLDTYLRTLSQLDEEGELPPGLNATRLDERRGVVTQALNDIAPR